MYLMSIPGLPFFGGGMAPMQAPTPPAMPTPAKMAITVTDSHVIIGEVSSVESVIRSIAGSGSTPVSSAEWYKRTSAAIPSVAGMIGLEDTSAGMEMLWWMFKQVGDAGGMNSMSPIGMMMDNPEMANIADFKLLPGYDAVKKYFGVSAAYGISRADGFYFESKYLDNPGQ